MKFSPFPIFIQIFLSFFLPSSLLSGLFILFSIRTKVYDLKREFLNYNWREEARRGSARGVPSLVLLMMLETLLPPESPENNGMGYFYGGPEQRAGTGALVWYEAARASGDQLLAFQAQPISPPVCPVPRSIFCSCPCRRERGRGNICRSPSPHRQHTGRVLYTCTYTHTVIGRVQTLTYSVPFFLCFIIFHYPNLDA